MVELCPSQHKLSYSFPDPGKTYFYFYKASNCQQNKQIDSESNFNVTRKKKINKRGTSIYLELSYFLFVIRGSDWLFIDFK